jgi:hypothetical protein
MAAEPAGLATRLPLSRCERWSNEAKLQGGCHDSISQGCGVGSLGAANFLAVGFAFRARFGGPRFHKRAFVYGPGFAYAPGWYGAGAYGLGWYEPYGYVSANAAGKVKLDTTAKDAMVYVDGGYAGTVKQLGTFPLKAGTHDVELRDPSGHAYFQERVNVIAGKTINLRP